MLKVSRSRGALSGVLLVLLGIWGGLIPLVGPYVNYAYTPNHAWRMTSGRVWLEILPAAAALLGGLILLASRLRLMALFGASLAAAGGAWFAVGRSLAPLWTNNLPAEGYPIGSHMAKAIEQIGFFTGLGVVIVCIAAVAIGRLSLVSVRDASTAERTAERAVVTAEEETPTAPTPARTGRWPHPRTPMRRVASAGPGELSGAATESGETIASTSSRR
jgi:hypothetical protein